MACYVGVCSTADDAGAAGSWQSWAGPCAQCRLKWSRPQASLCPWPRNRRLQVRSRSPSCLASEQLSCHSGPRFICPDAELRVVPGLNSTHEARHAEGRLIRVFLMVGKLAMHVNVFKQGQPDVCSREWLSHCYSALCPSHQLNFAHEGLHERHAKSVGHRGHGLLRLCSKFRTLPCTSQMTSGTPVDGSEQFQVYKGRTFPLAPTPTCAAQDCGAG